MIEKLYMFINDENKIHIYTREYTKIKFQFFDNRITFYFVPKN